MALIGNVNPGPGLQARSDLDPQIGMCNPCVAAAKQAVTDGLPQIPPVHAAVTQVPRLQMMALPGGQTIPAVFACPVCWDHIATERGSSLLSGNGLGLP